jgi:hypothetical protein
MNVELNTTSPARLEEGISAHCIEIIVAYAAAFHERGEDPDTKQALARDLEGLDTLSLIALADALAA